MPDLDVCSLTLPAASSSRNSSLNLCFTHAELPRHGLLRRGDLAQLCKLLSCGPSSLNGLGIPRVKAWLRENKVEPDAIRKGPRGYFPFPQRQRMRGQRDAAET